MHIFIRVGKGELFDGQKWILNASHFKIIYWCKYIIYYLIFNLSYNYTNNIIFMKQGILFMS